MSELSPELQSREFDKDKFDALLRKIATAKPLQARDVVTPPRRPKQGQD
jgi:hypothetical protein